MRYSGEKCPVCDKEFTADDDIVVCPECGTPHHRECYMLNNRCANEVLHAEGKKWERQKKASAFRLCPVCSFPNRVTDTACRQCGAEFKENTEKTGEGNDGGGTAQQWHDIFSMSDTEELMNPIKYLGLDPDEDMGGATMKEVTDFVGPGTMYYIPKFKKMKEEGAKPSFNIFSLFFPALFFANRKMWGWAILAAVLGILFNLPANLLLYIEELPADIAGFISSNKTAIENVNTVFMVADIGVRLVFCLFANWFYFRFSMNSLRRLKRARSGSESIRTSGGIKPLNMVFITIIKYGIGVIAVSGLYMAYEMITTVQDFSTLCIR